MTTIQRSLDTVAHSTHAWGNCMGAEVWSEFCKQETYAQGMQLFKDYGINDTLEFDMKGKSVLDIGGGPVSMTLRCTNASKLLVVDPCSWPASVHRRYKNYGIELTKICGEDYTGAKFDEVWIYNVLRYVRDPERVVKNAFAHGHVLRVFDFVWTPVGGEFLNRLDPTNLLVWLNMPVIKYFNVTPDNAFTGVFQPK